MATEGDRLWYRYDFGDDWDPVLTVEKVLDSPRAAASTTSGTAPRASGSPEASTRAPSRHGWGTLDRHDQPLP
ncbi:hypothetical protein [Phycicoccus sp. Soil802]|uniref:IS1096 element passenger TnpR family protein n=1 Tax=Phycicoccus sp. Soil802 TaxID=1736414 RepID=UPI0019108A37